MTRRFYLTGAETKEEMGMPTVFPSHFSDMTYGAFRYGIDNVFLVLADTSAEQHDFLIGQGVQFIVKYSGLSRHVPSVAVTAVREMFERLNIPGDWVGTDNTWRDVMRTIAGCFQLHQRIYGDSKKSLFRDGVGLSEKWEDVGVEIRRDILVAAMTLGWNLTVSPSSTLRNAFLELSAQWGKRPFYMAGMEF